MAARLDKFVTGPLPQPSGNHITLHFRLRDNGPKHDKGATMWENLDEGILTATSKLLWDKRAEHMYLVWKELGIVGTYIDWAHDRILRRAPLADGLTRSAEWTLLKYPKGKLGQYSPLVRDMHTLLNQWLLGWYLQDPTFMDVAMSTLQTLLEEPHDEDYDDGQETSEQLFRLLKAPVIAAIWANTAPGAKLRDFIVDYIVKHASHRQLMYFDGTITDDKDSSVQATLGTPKKAPHGFGSFTAPSRSSSRRSTLASASESDACTDSSGKQDPNVLPEAFMAEIKAARQGTLLVTQLPEHVRALYPGQVRVYLPDFPYVLAQAPTMRQFTLYSVEEEPILRGLHIVVSKIELQGPAGLPFYEAVYGEGKTIFRSAYWDAERDARVGLDAGDVEMADADVDAEQDSMRCVYHQHTEDRACWLMKNPLVNGGVWPN